MQQSRQLLFYNRNRHSIQIAALDGDEMDNTKILLDMRKGK